MADHHPHTPHEHAHPHAGPERRVAHQPRAFSLAQQGAGARLAAVALVVVLIWVALYFLIR
ncbi:MAG TPA: hypothetical protein VGM83_02200 [Devosiaceae bacterium]|jgi:hypothetical protein